MQLKVKLSTPDILFYRATDKSVGFDLNSTISISVLSGDRVCVPTGVYCEFPTETYGRVAGRSSLALKSGIIVGGGVIDPDYTGEIKVVLFNLSKECFFIEPGDRIAQLIVEKVCFPDIVFVTSLSSTARGSSGFGSTGA